MSKLTTSWTIGSENTCEERKCCNFLADKCQHEKSHVRFQPFTLWRSQMSLSNLSHPDLFGVGDSSWALISVRCLWTVLPNASADLVALYLSILQKDRQPSSAYKKVYYAKTGKPQRVTGHASKSLQNDFCRQIAYNMPKDIQRLYKIPSSNMNSERLGKKHEFNAFGRTFKDIWPGELVRPLELQPANSFGIKRWSFCKNLEIQVI